MITVPARPQGSLEPGDRVLDSPLFRRVSIRAPVQYCWFRYGSRRRNIERGRLMRRILQGSIATVVMLIGLLVLEPASAQNRVVCSGSTIATARRACRSSRKG